MKTRFSIMFIAICFIGLILAISCPEAQSARERTPLTLEEQTELLGRRINIETLGYDTFKTYAKKINKLIDVRIHTESQMILKTSMMNVFPKFYLPTFKEVLDALARQTLSSWTYDDSKDYWVFSPPAMNLPFTIKLSEDWVSEEKGISLKCTPSIASLGMDIFMFGQYSATENESQLFTKVRNECALRFTNLLNRNITIKDMKSVTVNGVDALYYQTTSANPRVILRQWAFVKSGYAFVILSLIDKQNEETILPEVQAMVDSFEVL